MFTVPGNLRAITLSFLCVCTLAVIEGLAIGLETVGLMLLISLLILPSIIAYVLSAAYLSGRPRLRYLMFFGPPVVIVAAWIVSFFRSTTDAEVDDILKWFLALYVSQIILALIVLSYLSRKVSNKNSK